jgi:hypothetical protein
VAKASDNIFPKVNFGEGAAPATPGAGNVRLYAKTDGLLYSKDDAGAETLVSGGAGGGGGDTFVGSPLIILPPWATGSASGSAAFNNDEAYAWPAQVTGTMLLQGLVFRAQATGAGTHEWGLFDYSSNPAAATKLAGGSSAIGSTGYVTIAASGAPVTVDPGNYVVILKAPAANPASYFFTAGNTAPGMMLTQASYTWDDTPNLTTGWTNSGGIITMYLLGRLSSGEQWP